MLCGTADCCPISNEDLTGKINDAIEDFSSFSLKHTKGDASFFDCMIYAYDTMVASR